MHESPTRALAFRGAGAPCGHAGQSDAVLDDREQLTIRELLGRRRPHVWRAWIQTKPDRRGTAAVVGVAHGTMIGEVLQAFGEHGLGWCHRIRHRPHLTRRCETPHGASHEYLDPRWLRTRTETATSDRIGQDSSSNAGDHDEDDERPNERLHVRTSWSEPAALPLQGRRGPSEHT